MNGKSILFLGVLMLLTISPMVAADVDLEGFLEIVESTFDSIDKYTSEFLLVLLFFLIFATFYLGTTVAFKDFGERQRGPVIVISLILSFLGTIGIRSWPAAWSYITAEVVGKAILFFLMILVLLLARRFMKGEKTSPLMISIVILFLYYVLRDFFPNLVNNLPGWAQFMIYLLLFVAGAMVVWEIGKFMMGSVLGSLHIKSPFSDRAIEGTKRYHKQMGELKGVKEERASATKLRRQERKTRYDVWKIASGVRQSDSVFGEILEIVGRNQPQVISGHNWRRLLSRIKKLGNIRSKIGGYVGLINRLVNDVEELDTVSAAKKTKLTALSNSLARTNSELGTKLETLESSAADYRDSNNRDDWKNLLKAAKEAQTAFLKIKHEGEGLQALEAQIRIDVEKA